MFSNRYKYNKDILLVFINFKHGYDIINKEKLWKNLTNPGISIIIVNLIKLCNN